MADIMRICVFNVVRGVNKKSLPDDIKYDQLTAKNVFSIKCLHALTANLIEKKKIKQEIIERSYINKYRPPQCETYFHPGYEHIYGNKKKLEDNDHELFTYYLITVGKSLTNKNKKDTREYASSILGSTIKIGTRGRPDFFKYFKKSYCDFPGMYTYHSESAQSTNSEIARAILSMRNEKSHAEFAIQFSYGSDFSAGNIMLDLKSMREFVDGRIVDEPKYLSNYVSNNKKKLLKEMKGKKDKDED
jgi:hypothetical protein